MNNVELCERLQALADSLVGDDWEHPLLSVETCKEAIMRLSAPKEYVLDDEAVNRIANRMIEIFWGTPQ